jgi:hypothetical protein
MGSMMAGAEVALWGYSEKLDKSPKMLPEKKRGKAVKRCSPISPEPSLRLAVSPFTTFTAFPPPDVPKRSPQSSHDLRVSQNRSIHRNFHFIYAFPIPISIKVTGKGYKKQRAVTKITPILRVEGKHIQSAAAVTRAQVKVIIEPSA